jgi:hypothetical protein
LSPRKVGTPDVERRVVYWVTLAGIARAVFTNRHPRHRVCIASEYHQASAGHEFEAGFSEPVGPGTDQSEPWTGAIGSREIAADTPISHLG